MINEINEGISNEVGYSYSSISRPCILGEVGKNTFLLLINFRGTVLRVVSARVVQVCTTRLLSRQWAGSC